LEDYTHIKLRSVNNSAFAALPILKSAKYLQSIEISKTELKENRNKVLCSLILKQESTLTYLNLSNLHLGVAEAKILATLITNSKKLVTLNLYGNGFGVEGANFIS